MESFICYEYWNQEVFKQKTIGEFYQNINKNGIHSLDLADLPLDILIKNIGLSDSNDYIMITFSGAVSRKANLAPFFSFVNIAEKIGLPMISFSDPSLGLAKSLGLSWYAGNMYYPELPNLIAEICDGIVEKTGKKLLMVGGSGGGFAALNIQSRMESKKNTKLIVWNPQTDLIAYSKDSTMHYMNTVYSKELEKANYSNLVAFVDSKIDYKISHDKECSRLILMDGYDYNHIRDLKLYFGEMKHSMSHKNLVKIDNTCVCFGDWGRFGDGHLPLPRDVAADIIVEVSKGKDFEYVDAVLSRTNTTSRKLLMLKGQKVDFSDVRVNLNFIDDLLELETNIHELFFGFELSFRIVESETNKIIYMGKRQDFTLRCREFIKLKNVDLNIKNISNYKVHLSLKDFLNAEHIIVKQLNFLNCRKFNSFTI